MNTPTDEADVSFTATMTDVRLKSSLADYEGQLQLHVPLRITDFANGLNPSAPKEDKATTQPAALDIVVPCVATPAVAIGSACAITTTADTIAPGAVLEGKRAIWETDQIEVRDGGSSGAAARSTRRCSRPRASSLPSRT